MCVCVCVCVFVCVCVCARARLTILRPCDDDGQLWMEADTGDILGMTFQGLDTGLVLENRKEELLLWHYKHFSFLFIDIMIPLKPLWYKAWLFLPGNPRS